jgi:hypothetical protein
MVATEILASQSKKERVKVIEFFIEGLIVISIFSIEGLSVAKHLAALKNFNSLMAVIAALNFNSVARFVTDHC